jgi:hypothetical protein
MNSIYEIHGSTLRYHFHPGQLRAWDCDCRWVVVMAGTQGGKTTFGPAWLWREIQRRGAGDYIVVTPTFSLLDKKALPEFLRLFEGYLSLGRYTGSPSRRFTFSEAGQRKAFGKSGDDQRTNIWFGYATNPDSLESMTAKGAWLDEAGQPDFKLGSWEAIQRRLSVNQGRALLTTTPYYQGWLTKQLAKDTDTGLINFKSIENPSFPRAEYERVRGIMPAWKFNMFYNGIATQPAGLIYDVFDRDRHVIAPFVIPYYHPRLIGLDFGGVNTAAVKLAEMSDGKFVLYGEYLEGGKTAAGHARDITAGEATELTVYGGAGSEDQWRAEFTAAGLRVMRPPVSDVEVGIDRVYELLADGRLQIFDTCVNTIEQLENYSRPVDEEGRVLEGIEDKETYHYLDALRYIGSAINGGKATIQGVSYDRFNTFPRKRQQNSNGR